MAIENHFIQKDFGIHAKLENLLLQAAKKKNYSSTLKEVMELRFQPV